MAKLKIGIVIRSFNRGGAEVLIREMFENETFNQKIESFDLIILDRKRTELLKDLKNKNYYIFNIFSSSFFGFFSEYYQLYKLIKKKQYQIIHSHLPNAGILIRILKLLLPRIKVIYTEHNVVDSYNKISFFLNGLTYLINDYTIFVSPEVQACVNKHVKPGFYKYKKSSVILNGVNADKFYCANKNASLINNYFTIGTVVSFRKWKRLDRWIEVAAMFKKNYPDVPVKFIIAGDGPEKKIVEELITLNKLNSYINVPGLIVDTVAVYKEIDIFLMTSEFEGLPVALLEAMSCSCIPVTSNVGGIKYLDFKGFGYKYEKFDPENLAKIIIQYYNNESAMVEERKKAREFVIRNNSLDKQVNEYIDIYNSI